MRRLAVPPRQRHSSGSARQTEQVLALAHLVSELMTIQDSATFTSVMLNRLREILHADVVSLWLHNSTSHRYILSDIASTQHHTIPTDDYDMITALQVRSGEALVGAVISTGTSQQVNSAEAYRSTFGALGRRREALFNRWRALLPREFRVSALGFGNHGRPLGVIEVFSNTRPSALLRHEALHLYLNQMAMLSQQLDQQIETLNQRRRLAALDAVVTAISTSSDVADLLDVTLQVVIEVVGASGGAICLLLPSSRELYLAAQSRIIPADEAQMLNSSQATVLLEDTVNYGEPSLRAIISTSEPHETLQGRAAMPLLAGGTIVGVLVLYGTYQQLESSINWPSLVSVGSQIGIAIANTQLYEESQRERQRLQTVIESIADGVAICNPEGQLILANQTASDMLGLSNIPTITALRDNDVRNVHGESIEPVAYPFARALAGEIFRDYRLVMYGAMGRDIVLSFSGAPLRGSAITAPNEPPQQDGAVVVFRDITEQRRLDEAKDEFLAVAAHELRSPLAAIKGYSDLMLRRELKRTDGDSRDLRGHQTLNQQVNVLMQLVDNLLDVSRIDAGRFTLQFEAVDLGALAETLIQQMRQTITHHMLIFEPSRTAIIHGDSLRLRQVVTNLITNAVRYSPHNTTVRVRIDHDEQWGYVTVDDEGPGIPMHQRDKLFERYFRVPGIRRTGSSTEGLGLGLYLCREIVALHEGTIGVDSASSGGARFNVALPLYHPTDSPRSAEQETLDLTQLLFGD